jgi:hypothetical protein
MQPPKYQRPTELVAVQPDLPVQALVATMIHGLHLARGVHPLAPTMSHRSKPELLRIYKD